MPTYVSAPSTRLILEGKSPALYSAALQGNRVKQDMIRDQKKETYPHRQGIPGMLYVVVTAWFPTS